LAFVLGVILFVAVSWGAFKAVTEAKADSGKFEGVQTLDSDIALANVIDSLEAHWNSRISYHFSVPQDPLFLGRVIAGYSYAKVGVRETQEDDLRLSATAILPDESSMAIIKYDGKSLVLKTGDRFGANYVVEEIQEKTVVLNRNGQRVVLHTKALAEETAQPSENLYENPNEF